MLPAVVPEHLVGWANQMAARFGRPVFLVGSALEIPNPRDWDVRIVLPNDEFTARYGIEADDVGTSGYAMYRASIWLPRQFPGLTAYFCDMAKLARQAVLVSHVNVDFQVQPLAEAYQYRNRERRRLDTLDGLEDALANHPEIPNTSPKAAAP